MLRAFQRGLLHPPPAEQNALPQNGSSLTRASHAAVLAAVKDATRR
jgi:hypothetical protein